ncbi:MAG: FxLYD domain-containing protein [Planctomycetes bacterium]|nr:FxLYD domain-containing protein [Planctomycetota bacterium]
MNRLTSLSAILIILISGAVYSAEEPDKFPINDLSVESMFGMYQVMGQITNTSGRTYGVAAFKLSFFDENEKLLGFADIPLMNLEDGDTVVFSGISQQDISNWKSYRIRLETGM